MRTLPVTGSEQGRKYDELVGHKIVAGEVHSTTQVRLFLFHKLISGPKPLGTVADETARLALNETSEFGCWPGDFCEQTTPSAFCLCKSNNGEATGDWIVVSLTGGSGGAVLRNSDGEPAAELGNVDDFCIDYSNWEIYGPKTEEGWGEGVSIIGAQGDKGTTGDKGDKGDQGIKGDKGDQGDTGTNGLSVCTVYLYKRAASSPAVPSGTCTFTFATGVLAGQDNGWTQAVPAWDGNPVYVISAPASAPTATDTIATGEWSTPAVVAVDGAQGPQGDAGVSDYLFLFGQFH